MLKYKEKYHPYFITQRYTINITFVVIFMLLKILYKHSFWQLHSISSSTFNDLTQHHWLLTQLSRKMASSWRCFLIIFPFRPTQFLLFLTTTPLSRMVKIHSRSSINVPLLNEWKHEGQSPFLGELLHRWVVTVYRQTLYPQNFLNLENIHELWASILFLGLSPADMGWKQQFWQRTVIRTLFTALKMESNSNKEKRENC